MCGSLTDHGDGMSISMDTHMMGMGERVMRECVACDGEVGRVDGLVVASALCDVLGAMEEGKLGIDVKGVVEVLVWMRVHGVDFGGAGSKLKDIMTEYGFFKYNRVHGMASEYVPSSCDGYDDDDLVLPSRGERRVSDGRGNDVRVVVETMYDMLMGMAFRVKDGESLDAVFDMAVRDGCCLSESSMVGKVASLLKEYDASTAFEFYCVAVGRGWKIDPFSYKAIVTSLVTGAVDGKKRYWDLGMKILHRFHMSTPHHIDTNIHTIIIGICGRSGWFGEMMDLHGLMLQDSIEPSTITWNAFITACQKLQRPHVAFQFLHAMRSMGVPADVNTYSSLLSCAASMKDSDVAQRMWALMIQDGVRPDRIVCGAYIWALLEGGHALDAANVFDEWVSTGVPPGWTPGGCRGVERFSQVSKEYERERNWYMYRKCLRLNRLMRSKGIKPEVLSLVDVTARAEQDGGYWIQAGRASEKFLQRHPRDLTPSIVAYSFAAIAHDRVGNRVRALELVGSFKKLWCSMNTSAEYATALNACSQLNALEPAVDLVKRAEKTGVKLSIQCFTLAIRICSATGDVECALWLLRKMPSFDLKPNQHTISCVLSLCGSANKVSGALKLFHSMEDRFGIKPDTVCFATMWDILGSSGAWKDACLFFIVAEIYHRDEKVAWPYSSLVPRGEQGDDPVCNVDMLRVLDLHMFSIVGAHTVVRLWLLLVRDVYMHGLLNDADNYAFDIITGQGRHSAGGVSKVKPAVESLLTHGLGKSISFQSPRSNVGIIRVCLRDLIVLFDSQTSNRIGFDSIEDEEEVLLTWKRATLSKAGNLLSELRSITH